MSNVRKVSIALTSELAETVREAVDCGDYASSSEVVREALRGWAERRAMRAAKLADLRAAVQAGLDSGPAEAREPMEDFLARNRKRLAELKRA
jgi:antitoxin ParD1/3/4